MSFELSKFPSHRKVPFTLMSPEESGHTDFAPQKTIEKRRLAFFSDDHHLSSAQNMPRKTFDPQLTSHNFLANVLGSFSHAIGF
jgi:hypothetical protein